MKRNSDENGRPKVAPTISCIMQLFTSINCCSIIKQYFKMKIIYILWKSDMREY
jgi:hypothetical protein